MNRSLTRPLRVLKRGARQVQRGLSARRHTHRVPWRLAPPVQRLLGVVRPYTMSDPLRLVMLYQLAREAARLGEGALVECGVCNGGSAAVLGAAVRRRAHCTLWLYDTFEGIPAPGTRDGPLAPTYTGLLKGTVEAVLAVLGKVGFPAARAVIRKGLFSDTFQEPLPDRVILLHVDADWYEGVLQTLQTFYARVPPGGVIVLDDFGHWEGARQAFYDFCAAEGIQPLLERAGYTQAFWRKGQEHNREIAAAYEHGIYRAQRP
jgi:O-methyltransferase